MNILTQIFFLLFLECVYKNLVLWKLIVQSNFFSLRGEGCVKKCSPIPYLTQNKKLELKKDDQKMTHFFLFDLKRTLESCL